jgi:hypothetical protein
MSVESWKSFFDVGTVIAAFLALVENRGLKSVGHRLSCRVRRVRSVLLRLGKARSGQDLYHSWGDSAHIRSPQWWQCFGKKSEYFPDARSG